MEAQRSKLLIIDAVINVVLGALLLFLPGTTIAFLGLPYADTLFYVSVLGAVLLGIGFALFMETSGRLRMRGLGLAGAVIINFLGAGTVVVWLIIDPFHMPTRGYVVLWSVAALVIGTGVVEIFSLARHRNRNEDK